MASNEKIVGLQFLLKAKSQSAVNEMFLNAFENRKKKVNEEQISFANERFKDLSPADAKQVNSIQ